MIEDGRAATDDDMSGLNAGPVYDQPDAPDAGAGETDLALGATPLGAVITSTFNETLSRPLPTPAVFG